MNSAILKGHLRQGELWRIIAPLALVTFLLPMTQTFFGALLARFESATDELAGYGVGIYLLILIMSPSLLFDQLALAYGENRAAYRRLFQVAGIIGLLLTGMALAVALIPQLRYFVIVTLQRAPDEATASRAAFLLLALAPAALVQSLSKTMRGALIKARKAHWVTVTYVVSRGALIICALLLYKSKIVHANPLLIPVIALLLEVIIRGVLFFVMMKRVVMPHIPERGAVPSVRQILIFLYPIVITSLVMAFSRPLINAFIGRLDDGKVSLAALAVVLPLSYMFYGWLNDTRVLPTVFRDEGPSVETIRRFARINTVFIFIVSVILFATPISRVLLRDIIGVSEELYIPCRQALIFFCFFPFVVSARGYLQGLCVRDHRTQAMTWSGPLRVAGIVLALIILTALQLPGAAVGAAALSVGFLVETASISYFMRASDDKRYGN